MIPFLDAVLPSSSVRTKSPIVTRGSLITFNYAFHKSDSFPLVLVTDTDYMPAGSPLKYLRGINLHYLTFPAIKKLIFPNKKESVCENPNFTYQYIKNNNYIISAFRQYKRSGIENIKKLDCQFVVNTIGISRSFAPNEIEAIRKSVREQISRMTNQQAAPTGEVPL